MEGIRIFCENTGSYEKVDQGIALGQLYEQLCARYETFEGQAPVLAALVDNRLQSLDYRIINPHNVLFIGYDHPIKYVIKDGWMIAPDTTLGADCGIGVAAHIPTVTGLSKGSPVLPS